MSTRVTHPSLDQRLDQAALNGQGLLIVAAAPTGKESLIGKPLVDCGELDVLGTYRCLIPLAGMVSECNLYVQATFASGTVTTDANTLYFVRNLSDPSTWTAKTASTSGEGAMSTGTLQTINFGTLVGEQWGVLDIVLGTAAACTFTRAEFCGL